MAKITLPQLSEGADSGTVVSIFVQPGDTIEKNQTILELENDKAVAPIPADKAGAVQEIHVNEGDEINVGDLLLTLDTTGKGEKPAEKPAQQSQKEESQKEEQADEEMETPASIQDSVLERQYQSKSGFPPPASPTIRRMAKTMGLDLTKVPGSKKGGRIVMEDIQKYIHQLQSMQAGKGKQPTAEKEKSQPQSQAQDFSAWGETRREKLPSIRKTIGQRMQQSWSEIPHVFQFNEADITDLMEKRKRYKAAYKKQDTNLTLTALAVKATVHALKEYPIFNASLDESTNEIVYKQYFHIGIAVDTDFGLLVPVLRDADQKSLLDISKELHTLAQKARERKLTNEDMQGSSFTISNLGGIGGTYFTPIVYKPNSAILGMGKGYKRLHEIDDEILSRIILPICVSYDHRLIDGADGARFAEALVKAFEQFDENEISLQNNK